MTLNQPDVTIEPKPADQRLATTHTTATLPATWQTPQLAPTHLTGQQKHTETTTTLLAPHTSDQTTLPNHSRQIKIIVTLGPATANGEVLRRLLEAGVSVFRVNLACISRESALKAVYAIRSISTELQRPVALLLDPQLSSGVAAASPTITENDWADLRFGLECGVDWLAVSAHRDGHAVRQLRQILTDQKRTNIGILARIESPSALLGLDQIIQDADGIVLGGDDLVSERPAAELLGDWQAIIPKCVNARKLAVIVSRANADVTSALCAQPDAVMLAAETSVGANPLHSVQMLDGLIRREESGDCRRSQAAVALTNEQDKTIAAAVRQAAEMEAEAIVVLTRAGNSAALCAALRPRLTRVFVFTPDARLARRLRLGYALEPIVLPFTAQPNTTFAAAEKILRERNFVTPGAKVVFITDPRDAEARTSSVQVREIA